MARRRTATRDLVALPATVEGDEQLLVRSSKVASHAAKAQKETRRAARAERKLAKAERRAVGDAARLAAEQAATETDPPAASRRGRGTTSSRSPKADESGLTGAKVRRYIGVARIVVPVLAPIVYQGLGAARAQWDQQRARRLGVAPDELSEFSGRGTALYARVHHLAVSTRDLRTRRGGHDEVRQFADDADARLSDLEAAVRAAEQMPAARRRAAHVAVGAELDRLESRLLTLWGLDAAPTHGASRAD